MVFQSNSRIEVEMIQAVGFNDKCKNHKECKKNEGQKK